MATASVPAGMPQVAAAPSVVPARAVPAQAVHAPAADAAPSGAAQVAAAAPPPAEEDPALIRVAHLPVELDVVVPVKEFRVRHLLALEPGNVIESQWSYGEDVPLSAGRVELARSEFEVVENQLAVRITRLP